MANQQLTDYIKQQIQAGYDVNTLRNYLIQNGYPKKDVDESINSLYHPEVKHVVHHLSKNTIIFVAAIVFILLLIPTVYFFISQQDSTPARLLDLRTSIITSSVNPGGKLEFNIELSNLGKSKRYDVLLKYEVVGTDISREETIAVETSTSKKSFIDIPSDTTPKKYMLKTTATYGDNKALSTIGFTVKGATTPVTNQTIISCIENWNCNDWMPSVCPSNGQQTRICTDANDCKTTQQKPDTSRTCVYSVQPPEPQPIQVINTSGLTVWQRLDSIKAEAQTDPTKAEKDCGSFDVESHRDECYGNVAVVTLSSSLCEKIIGDRTKDTCYKDVAKLTKNSELCEKISAISRKDTCYMNFVSMKDYTVCEKIDNSYYREACVALRDMPNLVVN